MPKNPGEFSVHDNILYGMSVDFVAQIVVLHTYYPRSTGNEYTDVIFEGVLIDFLEDANFRDGNILFDVEMVTIRQVIASIKEVLVEKKNYRWPPLEYTDLVDLESQLMAMGMQGFEVSTSLGLSGWVISKSCRREHRTDRLHISV